MSEPRANLEEWLLDDHLGQLTDAEHEQLLQALRGDSDLAARNMRLQQVLRPLDTWTTPPPPVDLTDRILRRVAAYDANPPTESASTLPSAGDGEYSRGPIFSFRELLAVAAVLAFFIGVLIPSMTNVRARSRQLACATNLGTIGQGVATYAAANAGRLPSIRVSPGSAWLSVRSSGTPYTPNSRSRYLVLRLRYVSDPGVFVCPSRRDGRIMQAADPGTFDDFTDPQNCSYDSLNMAGPTPRLSAATAIPYMADANPLFHGRKIHRVDPEKTNSYNHRNGTGQNVLLLDGSVHWFSDPNCGRRGDNIWQAGTIREYNGTEVQESPEDTFLVP